MTERCGVTAAFVRSSARRHRRDRLGGWCRFVDNRRAGNLGDGERGGGWRCTVALAIVGIALTLGGYLFNLIVRAGRRVIWSHICCGVSRLGAPFITACARGSGLLGPALAVRFCLVIAGGAAMFAWYIASSSWCWVFAAGIQAGPGGGALVWVAAVAGIVASPPPQSARCWLFFLWPGA